MLLEMRLAACVNILPDIKSYFWSRSLGTISVSGTGPGGAPLSPEPMFVFDWKDQIVTILGVEYRLNDSVTLRAGYNRGDSPVPDDSPSKC